MSCRLLQNIKHTCEYNSGGISEIYLLDYNDFVSYHFFNDSNFDTCIIDEINASGNPVLLDSVDESNFNETYNNGIYTQQLTTFIRSIDGLKTNSLLTASNRRYVVIFKTYQGNYYTFGQDGGVSLSFSQVVGQIGETIGYNILLTKESIYTLYELISFEIINNIYVLGTENNMIMCTEDELNAIEVYEYGR